MHQRLLIAGAITVIIVTAGCAGLFANDRPNDSGTPTTAASAGTNSPLKGVAFWIGGRLINANRSTLVLDTGEKQIVLRTTHAVFFEPTDSQQKWESVDTWTNKDMGADVCLSAHLHEDDDLHVVKAFYNSTCTPIAQ